MMSLLKEIPFAVLEHVEYFKINGTSVNGHDSWFK